MAFEEILHTPAPPGQIPGENISQLRRIYNNAIDADQRHQKFLATTASNLSWLIFGRYIAIPRYSVNYPSVNILEAMSDYRGVTTAYLPEPYNPVSYLVNAFVDEIGNAKLRTSVRPFPSQGTEPQESFSNILEQYLIEMHRVSGKPEMIRKVLIELFLHSYFALYTDGKKYWPLSAYEFVPGSQYITDVQMQPFIMRKTAMIRGLMEDAIPNFVKCEAYQEIQHLDPTSYCTLLDIWIKPLDLNVVMVGSGKVLYTQKFPEPKRYPFSVGLDSNIFNSFYTVPEIGRLIALLVRYQEAEKSLEDSAKSIGKSIMTVDKEANIDIDRLILSLREGYRHTIVEKNQVGSLSFVTPTPLPAYAINHKAEVFDQMMKHLGLNPQFLGGPAPGIRERGAMGRLIRATFRKLFAKASIIERAVAEIDQYCIDYTGAHTLMLSDKLQNIGEIFVGKTNYIAAESFEGFATQDLLEEKNMTLAKFRSKLISQEDALNELGHDNPRKIKEKIFEEQKAQVEFAAKMKKLQEKPPSLFDEISTRLLGNLKYRFSLIPGPSGKIIVEVHEEEIEYASFILADLSERVLVQSTEKKEKPKEPEVPGREEEVEREEHIPAPAKPSPAPPAVGPPPPETRGRPPKVISTPELAEKIVESGAIKPVSPGSGHNPGNPEGKKKGLSEVEATTRRQFATTGEKKEQSFSEAELRMLMKRRKTVSPDKFMDLPGLYLVEPHAKWIHTGKKLLLVKAKKFDIVDQPHLLAGEKIYGVIKVRRITSNFDFDKTQKYHQVSIKEKDRWWKGKTLYAYLFEYFPFTEPLDYNRESGVQTFIKKVSFVKKKKEFSDQEIGVPFMGDLKPKALRPWVLPPVHKPEKKAFTSSEFFDLKRLKELIPEATYVVSEKIDGLRAFLWVHEGKAKMFSDEGTEWPRERILPILEDAEKRFKQTVLLDGELIMGPEIERKDVTGYIHSKQTPEKSELEVLRYITWDILYMKDKSIADKPFSQRRAILNLIVPAKRKGIIERVREEMGSRDKVSILAKKLKSDEGAIIRDSNAAYWATHSTYKWKITADFDAKILFVEKTKAGLPVFHMSTREGIYIGQTYAQSQVKGKTGDVIRVNIQKVTLKPDGSIGWFAPRPISLKKEVKETRPSLKQPGIGRPDTMALLKEIYLKGGGTEKKWDEWMPVHEGWRKEVMPKLIERLKGKVEKGV